MREQSCKTCALFDIAAAMDIRGRVLRTRHVRCGWLSIEPYPDAVAYPWKRPVAGYTSASNGIECRCYRARDGAITGDA